MVVDDAFFKRVLSVLILIVLLILSFFILKPILLSVALGFILAFIFAPVYRILFKATKSSNLSASLVCFILIITIILPVWFFTPMVIDQGLKVYQSVQETDFVTPLQTIFPSLFASEQFSQEVGGMLRSFTSKIANYALNYMGDFLLKFPTLMLHFLVVLFTFFFVLKDKEEIRKYVGSLLPFSEVVQKRFFDSSRAITGSVLYGQVVLGIIQGVIVGIGFFIFGVPNAFLLSILAILLGIIPIIGPMFVWVPVLIYMLVQGDPTVSIVGILIFGIIGSNIDTFLRPIIVSKASNIHSGVILIGMIGGLFFFGVIGLLLGPLVLAYLLIVLDIYRDTFGPKTIVKK
ncbi:MAG: AI-2E family transporter [Nanoarchaeota archaeon]|nr:AI-2E family transporter [Nanoarchaeota archaeon]